jgi:hypothetical protein
VTLLCTMGDNPYKYCNFQWEIIHALLSCDNIFFVNVYIYLFSLVLFCCVCCIDDCSMFGLEINKITIIIIIITWHNMYVFEIGSIVDYFHFHLFSENRGPRLMSRSVYRSCGEHSFQSVSEPRQFMNITELFKNSFV